MKTNILNSLIKLELQRGNVAACDMAKGWRNVLEAMAEAGSGEERAACSTLLTGVTEYLEQSDVVCGYCRAIVGGGAYAAHDITHHDGYRRTADVHLSLCGRLKECQCRIVEYQRVAEDLGLLPSEHL